MSRVFDIAGVGLILAFLSYMLKETGFKGWKLISVLGIVALFFFAGQRIGGFLEGLSDRFSTLGLSATLSSVARILGVGYVFGISSDVCREMGESGVANGVLVAGRVEILLLCMPYFAEILDISGELLGL